MSVERDLTLYEKRVDALLQLLPKTGGPTRETFLETQLALKTAPDQEGYFDRWVESLAEKLVANGVIAPEELAAKLADVRAVTEKWDAAGEAAE